MPATTKTTTKKTATPAKTAAKAPTKAPAKAPAKKPAGATKAVAPKATPRAAPAAKTGRKHPVTADQRRYYVEVAAYYIAEGHGFQPGRELADWTAAEVEIDRLLAEGALNP